MPLVNWCCHKLVAFCFTIIGKSFSCMSSPVSVFKPSLCCQQVASSLLSISYALLWQEPLRLVATVSFPVYTPPSPPLIEGASSFCSSICSLNTVCLYLRLFSLPPLLPGTWRHEFSHHQKNNTSLHSALWRPVLAHLTHISLPLKGKRRGWEHRRET